MPSTQIRADVLPSIVTVTADDGTVTTYEKARVIVTLDHAYVFMDGHPAPTTVFEDRMVSYTPPIPPTRVRKAAQLLDRHALLETDGGHTVKFSKQSNCGCGMRLKHMKISKLLPDNMIPQAASTHDK